MIYKSQKVSKILKKCNVIIFEKYKDEKMLVKKICHSTNSIFYYSKIHKTIGTARKTTA